MQTASIILLSLGCFFGSQIHQDNKSGYYSQNSYIYMVCLFRFHSSSFNTHLVFPRCLPFFCMTWSSSIYSLMTTSCSTFDPIQLSQDVLYSLTLYRANDRETVVSLLTYQRWFGGGTVGRIVVSLGTLECDTFGVLTCWQALTRSGDGRR